MNGGFVIYNVSHVIYSNSFTPPPSKLRDKRKNEMCLKYLLNVPRIFTYKCLFLNFHHHNPLFNIHTASVPTKQVSHFPLKHPDLSHGYAPFIYFKELTL